MGYKVISEYITSQKERDRDYQGQDLWEIYDIYKTQKDTLKKLMIFPEVENKFRLKMVTVVGTSYQLLDFPSSGENIVRDTYAKLAASAKKEVETIYGKDWKDASSDGINLSFDKNTETSQTNSILEDSLNVLIENIFNTLGPNFTTATLDGYLRGKKILNPSNMQKAGEQLLKDLLSGAVYDIRGGSTGGSGVFSALKKDKLLTQLIKELINKKERSNLRLGILFENIIKYIGMKIVTGTTGPYKDFETFFDTFEQRGAGKVRTTYTDLSGKQISKDITTTPDILVGFNESKNSTGISVKLAKNPFKITYKTVTGLDDALSGIAHFNNVLKTIAVWSADASPTGKRTSFFNSYNLHKILGAALASIAIGGYAEDRALLLLTFGQGKISVKSIDLVLKSMMNSNPVVMTGLVAANKADYFENLKILASGRGLDGSSKLDGSSLNYEIYQKYSDLREIHINYRLQTTNLKIT